MKLLFFLGIATFHLSLLFFYPTNAQPLRVNDNVTIHGQLRTGYYFIESRNNAGAITKTPEWRVRARFGMTYRFTDYVSFTARLAGRYSTVQEKFEFWYQPYAASPSGLRLGQTAFDMFYIQWTHGDRWMVQAGRMQHSFQLRGVIPKGIDRYHSPNVSIAWTDGVWVRYLAHRNWYVHGIVQYNHRKGSTSYYTPPMNFQEPSSRFTGFVAIEGKETSGLWNQREVSVTLIPSSFRNSTDELKPYLVFTGRLGISLPLHIQFMKIMIAGEAGYIPSAPDLSQFKLSDEAADNNDAFAWQVSINFLNIFDRHNIGFLYGETDPAWLIAPSFRNNTNTFEVRHQFRFNRSLSTEIRYRIRNQLYMPIDAEVKRKDDDLYARITYRF